MVTTSFQRVRRYSEPLAAVLFGLAIGLIRTTTRYVDGANGSTRQEPEVLMWGQVNTPVTEEKATWEICEHCGAPMNDDNGESWPYCINPSCQAEEYEW